MTTHTITLELTTEQLVHLNDAMNEHYECNADALTTDSFKDERLPLIRQCEALQTFIDSIKHIVAGAKDAD